MTTARLRELLAGFGEVSVAVVGDFFVDRYFDVDPRIAEVSLETGRTAHQAVRVRTSPGGGANVAHNVATLGVGRVAGVTCLGRDFDGYEMKRLMAGCGVDMSHSVESADRMTPSYNKPMVLKDGRPYREFDRVDVQSRARMPRALEDRLMRAVTRCVAHADGVLIADQIPGNDRGVITARMHGRLRELAARYPSKPFFADSRCRIGRFRGVIVKPNRDEAAAALRRQGRVTAAAVREGALKMSRRTGEAVYVTLGARGCLCVHEGKAVRVPTVRLGGALDIVGAGDSFAAAALTALCAGANYEEAALIGNLAASITVEQIGITGTATSAQVRRRFSEFLGQRVSVR